MAGVRSRLPQALDALALTALKAGPTALSLQVWVLEKQSPGAGVFLDSKHLLAVPTGMASEHCFRFSRTLAQG